MHIFALFINDCNAIVETPSGKKRANNSSQWCYFNTPFASGRGPCFYIVPFTSPTLTSACERKMKKNPTTHNYKKLQFLLCIVVQI